ncbi:MAG TPA: hypothetical protein VFS32_08435 [Candidatus Limnocylindrales bacterium]|nr:hypothetical protein [Candidatus Limnocylindrales bacterium]
MAFDALTEEWRLRGQMEIAGRLTDALNRREPIPIRDVEWAPIDGSAPPAPAPGLRSMDPYDVIVVLGGEDSQPALTDAERVAHRVHKIAYDVALELPPARVVGTIYLYPGSEPARLLDRATEMFVAVTAAEVSVGGQRIEGAAEVVLINRSYLRGVDQIDLRTGERPQPLPGQPLGGISWQDRSR